jgi:hypothetical protein
MTVPQKIVFSPIPSATTATNSSPKTEFVANVARGTARKRRTEPAPRVVTATYAVTTGQDVLGHVLEIAGGEYEARTPAGELVGTYAARLEASRALPSQVSP